jgi:hypothetical protein
MTAEAARSAVSHAAARAAVQTTMPAGLVLATACPRCGAAVPSEASDFCEACSAHLYPGHCVFCLEACSPGQAYCRQCGLPPEGVVCGACGTFSRFDFCPNPDCGAGLTPRAAAEMARVATDPETVEAFAELDEIGEVLQAVESGSGGHSAAAAPEAAPVASLGAATTATPTPAPRPNLAALRAAARGATTAEEKARVRKLAEQAAQQALDAVSSRSYPTAQAARAAGTALQVSLRFRVVSERLEVIAWRCHAFSCEHPMPGGMSLCSDPSKGGVPLTRVITEVQEGNAEFSV